MSFEAIPIFGFQSGLVTNKKPFLLPDEAFAQLNNAYVWRDRVKKREGLEFLGRLRREFDDISLPVTVAGGTTLTFNLLDVSGFISAITQAVNAVITTIAPHGLTTGDIVTISQVLGMTQINGLSSVITVTGTSSFTLNTVNSSGFTAYSSGGFFFSNRSLSVSEPDAELQLGSIVITIGAPDTATFTDNGNGTFTVTGLGVSAGSFINYATGAITLQFSVPLTGGASVTVTMGYYPKLPVQNIPQRELAAINDEQSIFFDTKYAYIFNGTLFEEFIPGTTWAGTNSDFYWTTNYRGVNPQDRLFFVTNFVNDDADPMRYTNGTTWTDFAPQVDASSFLFSARVLIPYYGRLIALNVWEGVNRVGAINVFNRCRFSSVGDPIGVNSWRSDIFGQGGFLDAPTNESIINAGFIKNSLIVMFENSTWQLRYLGEYGLPFIWERVSSDLGSESTFSIVTFDKGELAVGDKAIISADATGVNRIDLAIPDQIFDFQNINNGVKRVQGVRDYQRELVFWNYANSELQSVFPNYVLVFNYRNNSFGVFRDNVTALGTFQRNTAVTWDSQDIFWDDEDITWDQADAQALFPLIVSGNQEGYVHFYGYTTPDEMSLSISAINLSVTPITLTVTDHNLQDGEIIYVTDLQFIDTVTSTPVSTSLNNTIYRVTVVDRDTIALSLWNFVTQAYETNFAFTPAPGSATYIGGGQVALFPKLEIQTKDFNPFQATGLQTKVSKFDFLMDSTASASMSVQIYLNSSPAVQGNLVIGNKESETFLPSPYFLPASDIAWHSFYATLVGQYFRVFFTYDDDLMNTIETHRQKWTLNGANLWARPGGKIVF